MAQYRYTTRVRHRCSLPRPHICRNQLSLERSLPLRHKDSPPRGFAVFMNLCRQV